MSWQPELDELAERKRIAREMGGPERIARQHAAGRLTVRERIDRMVDPGSLLELGSIAGRATYDPDQREMVRLPAGQRRVRTGDGGRPAGGDLRR